MPPACKRGTKSRKRPREMPNFLRALGLGAEALMSPAVGGPLRCDRWLGARPAPPEPWVPGSRRAGGPAAKACSGVCPQFSWEQPCAPRPACCWDVPPATFLPDRPQEGHAAILDESLWRTFWVCPSHGDIRARHGENCTPGGSEAWGAYRHLLTKITQKTVTFPLWRVL